MAPTIIVAILGKNKIEKPRTKRYMTILIKIIFPEALPSAFC